MKQKGAMVVGWEPALSATIPGEPVGKGRPRVCKTHVFTPAKTRDWAAYAVGIILAEAEHNQGPPIDSPCRVVIRAIASRPKNKRGKQWPDTLMHRTSRPDGDNVEKAVLDALVTAGVLADDRYVCRCSWASLYAETTGAARVEVSVWKERGER